MLSDSASFGLLLPPTIFPLFFHSHFLSPSYLFLSTSPRLMSYIPWLCPWLGLCLHPSFTILSSFFPPHPTSSPPLLVHPHYHLLPWPPPNPRFPPSPSTSPHQLHVGELLCQCVRVVADREHVLLDGRRLGLEGHQLVRDGGRVEGDLDDALFPLAHQGQPLTKLLQHLVQGFPVRLRRGERRGEKRREESCQ